MSSGQDDPNKGDHSSTTNIDGFSLMATSNKIQLKPKIPPFLFSQQISARKHNSYNRLSAKNKNMKQEGGL